MQTWVENWPLQRKIAVRDYSSEEIQWNFQVGSSNSGCIIAMAASIEDRTPHDGCQLH